MFNIITPTYNRAHTLNRVFQSLLQQTYTQFKWIVVDDCSTDKTYELIQKWREIYPHINIDYHVLEKNQGKPYAVNFGLNRCDFPYTIIADSDDEFAHNTLADLKQIWQVVGLNKNRIGAIWTLDIDENNNIIGEKFPKDFWQVNFTERVLKRRKQITGDKWHCWKTTVLKANRLYYDTDSHIEESQTWNKINRTYDFLCVNITHLKVYKTQDSLITSKKSRLQLSRKGYYSSYYGLKDVNCLSIITYRYYRSLAFEYAKSKLFYNDKFLKLSMSKYLISLVIFIIKIPFRLLYKIL